MSFTYSIYANGTELLETENRASAISYAKTKADELSTTVTVYENDESNGEQYFVLRVEPVGKAGAK